MSATIAQAQSRADFSANTFKVSGTVTIAPGTQYKTGGFGPLAFQLAFNLGIDQPVPLICELASMSNPPTGFNWVYNYATDKIQAYVTGSSASGSPPETGELVELANNVYFNAGDVVAVYQVFNREA
jgi:hypothetical protein